MSLFIIDKLMVARKGFENSFLISELMAIRREKISLQFFQTIV
jgi:hypothetical protein